MYTIAQCYSRVSTPFGASGPYYTPGVGHRGTDFDHDEGETVVAYEDMVIEFVGVDSALGHVVGARFADGSGFPGWAHLRNIQSFANGFVPAGAGFAESAGRGDGPGSSWTGAHIHTTISTRSARNAALGILPLIDPAPVIAEAVRTNGSATAGLPKAAEEYAMYRLIGNADTNNRDIYLAGPGGALHVRDGEDLAALRAVLLTGTATFRQIKIAETYFYTLIHGYKTTLIKPF